MHIPKSWAILFSVFCLSGTPVYCISKDSSVRLKIAAYIDSAHKYLYIDQQKAIVFGERVVKWSMEIKNYQGAASGYNVMGNAHHLQGRYADAYKFYTNALKVAKKSKNPRVQISSYINLGYVFMDQSNYDLAKKNLYRAVKLSRATNDSVNLGNSYNNLAVTFYYNHELDSGLNYHLKALEIRQRLKQTAKIATSLTNIGVIYYEMKEFEKSLTYHKMAYKIDSINVSPLVYMNLGMGYFQKGEKDKALQFCKKAYAFKNEGMEPYVLADLYMNFFHIYRALGDYKNAALFADRAMSLRDTVTSEESKKIIRETEAKYENAKKELLINNLKKDKLRKDAELAHQSLQNKLLVFGIIGILVFLAIVYNGYKQKKKSNIEILTQKHLLEEKQREIIDSINYAKRLQEAILPPEEHWRKTFAEYFVLYKPKDIVAGDFYFFEARNEHIVFAAADCTGHGVPGAMVSVVCSNALHRSVSEFSLTEPGAILNKARELVLETFDKSVDNVRDGMDISLCSLKFRNSDLGFGNSVEKISEMRNPQSEMSLLWAGANNPLWIFNNGELREIKPDKQPIGLYSDAKPFTTHALQVKKGDTLYMFTDGYQDQFGGDGGKKFKASNLRKTIESIVTLPMEVQKEKLIETFETWQGKLEQLDDVCIIGVRL